MITRTHYGEVNCDLFLGGDKEEIEKIQSEEDYSYSGNIHIKNCFGHAQARGYFSYPISKAEKETALAYILVVFRNSKQVERLFKSIYRTNNIYCIHVDSKSDSEFILGIQNMTKCLKNVFVINSWDVKWGTMTTLKPELECMKLLYENKEIDWQYLINLTGEEFPLKSNNEIVRIVNALNGSNWIGVESELPKFRYDKKESPPPFGLTLYKGSVHVVLCRGFVRFILENETSATFLNWLEDTQIPDETFYATLNFNSHILQIPGAYSGENDPLKSDSSYFGRIGNRYKQWFPNLCHGFHVRAICILGAGDMPYMVKSKALFANKFHPHYNPSSVNCLDWWINQKSFKHIEEFEDDYLDYYRYQDFVEFHI